MLYTYMIVYLINLQISFLQYSISVNLRYSFHTLAKQSLTYEYVPKCHLTLVSWQLESNNAAYNFYIHLWSNDIQVAGDVNYYKAENEDNFTQAGNFWRNVLTAQEKDTLVTNLVNSLKVTQKFIQDRAVQNFTMVDSDFGMLLQNGLMAAVSIHF